MKTNEQIFEEIKTRGYISEQQISANEVKEMARGYDFTVSSVEKFKKTGRLCYVWIVDEGDPATTVTRAFNMGYNVKNMEVKRWNRIIQERA